MTVTTTDRRHRFEPGSARAAEPIPFPYLAPEHLRVVQLVPGAKGLPLVRDVDFALGGDGAQKKGTIRALRTFPAGAFVEVRRVTRIEQNARIKPHEPLPAGPIELQLDRHTLSLQEVDDDIADTRTRALLLPDGEVAAPLLPRAARIGGRKKLLAIDQATGEIQVEEIGATFVGDTGPANSTYRTIAGISDADTTNLSAIRADGEGGLYTYVTGDFTGEVDNDLVVASTKQPVSKGAWVLTTNRYVPSWDKLDKIIVPTAYTRVTTGGFYPQGIWASRVGGANYRLDTDQVSTVTTAWRKRTRNGRWFVLDEPIPNLYQLGLRGDGSDEADLLEAAFRYMEAQAAGSSTSTKTLLIPRATFAYFRDVRIRAGGFDLEGVSQGGNLQGKNGAKLILGYIDPIRGEGSGNTSVKCYRPVLRNFSIKPADNHDGPCIRLEFVDEITLDHMDIGPFNMTGGSNPAFNIGIEVAWVQFMTLRNTIINTNGNCVRFVLDNLGVAHNENEDHYLIDSKCQLYIGKKPPNGRISACINIHHSTRRSRFGGIQNLEIKTAHFYDNGGGNVLPSGILFTSDFTESPYRSVHNLRVEGGMWENIHYGVDGLRGMQGTARVDIKGSILGIAAINCGKNGGSIVYGGGRDRVMMFVDQSCFTQVGYISRNAQLTFGNSNNFISIDGLTPDSPTTQRFANKYGPNTYNGLAKKQRVTMPGGATTLRVPHGLSPSVNPNWAVAAALGSTPASLAVSIQGTEAVITSSVAAPDGGLVIALDVEALDT